MGFCTNWYSVCVKLAVTGDYTMKHKCAFVLTAWPWYTQVHRLSCLDLLAVNNSQRRWLEKAVPPTPHQLYVPAVFSNRCSCSFRQVISKNVYSFQGKLSPQSCSLQKPSTQLMKTQRRDAGTSHPSSRNCNISRVCRLWRQRALVWKCAHMTYTIHLCGPKAIVHRGIASFDKEVCLHHHCHLSKFLGFNSALRRLCNLDFNCGNTTASTAYAHSSIPTKGNLLICLWQRCLALPQHNATSPTQRKDLGRDGFLGGPPCWRTPQCNVSALPKTW
eukprot:3967686-Amphidinium_carterae.1